MKKRWLLVIGIVVLTALCFLSLFVVHFKKSGKDIGEKKGFPKEIWRLEEKKELATKYSDAKDYDKAIKVYQKIIDSLPKDTETLHALMGMASCYISKKQYDKAIKTYQKIIDDYPNHKITEGATQNIIADCYTWAGDYEKAKEAYRIVIEKYPHSKFAISAQESIKNLNDPNYIKTLKAMLLDPKKYDKAIEKYQRIIDKSSGSTEAADALFKMMSCYFWKRDYNMAIKVAERAIKDFPSHREAPNAQNTIGLCYEILGDYDKAKEIYKIVIEKYPDTEVFRLSNERLKFLSKCQNGKMDVRTP